jgi:hypothetical protein
VALFGGYVMGNVFPIRETQTKRGLLQSAKGHVEAGDKHHKQAAAELVQARDCFGATQREMAEAIGRSQAWVNGLIQWHERGARGTAFGPQNQKKRAKSKLDQSTNQGASAWTDAEIEAEIGGKLSTPEQDTQNDFLGLARVALRANELDLSGVKITAKMKEAARAVADLWTLIAENMNA